MKLTVKPTDKQDADSGLAVIDPVVMKELGVESDDYVVIEGHQGDTVVARVRPDPVEGVGRVIRIDGQLRRTADVMIGERVVVEPVDAEPAERVTLALPQDFGGSETIELSVRDQLVNRTITSEQILSIRSGGGSDSPMGRSQRVPMKVVDTEPSGTVMVREWTDIMVSKDVVAEVSIDDERAAAVTYEDIGGLGDELDLVRELIELPIRYPELFHILGIEPPNGILLYGPPGTGKTLLAKAVAGETEAHFQTISGPEILSKYQGESEEQLREVFSEAAENAPAIIFIDEIDSITAKREMGGEVAHRIVGQLLALMDGLTERGRIAVIGTTNRVNSVDPALRRPGRFDREIEIGVPDESDREEILEIHTRDMPIDGVDLEAYAARTHGFVGADLENLVKESAMCALRRSRPDLEADSGFGALDNAVLDSLRVTEDDFEMALHGIEPSALREVFVEVPDVSWDDVGGLSAVKGRLRETVQWPLEYSEAFERVDLHPAKGLLLYGPPGTGKTLLAKAVANEAQSNFISVKGPELLDKYVGESERGVREMFSKARENAPTVVFFDEIDAIATERGQGSDANVGKRVVSQLLTELDGLEALEDVVVIAATNRPDLIDDALIRSGRLDRHVHVSVPDEDARREIFAVHTQNKPLADDVDLADLAARTDEYVGADIEAVCREASIAAVREYIRHASRDEAATTVGNIELTRAHFERAFDEVDIREGGDSARLPRLDARIEPDTARSDEADEQRANRDEQ